LTVIQKLKNLLTLSSSLFGDIIFKYKQSSSNRTFKFKISSPIGSACGTHAGEYSFAGLIPSHFEGGLGF